MTQDLIRSLAQRQLHDYRKHRPGTYFGEPGELMSLRDAYRISLMQCELRQSAGEIRAGYKVGCTSPEIFKAFGIRGPVFGFPYQEEIVPSGTGLRSENFHNLAIEAEMAIKLGDDLGVDAVFPFIELHNLLFRGKAKTLQELVANNCFNAGAVMPQQVLRESAVECVRLGLKINGELIEEGHPWCFSGGPAASLEWLSSALAEHQLQLHPGDIILAGTNFGIHRVYPGDRIEVLLNGQVRVESDVVS